jgi:hypothetical protein
VEGAQAEKYQNRVIIKRVAAGHGFDDPQAAFGVHPHIKKYVRAHQDKEGKFCEIPGGRCLLLLYFFIENWGRQLRQGLQGHP